MLHPPGVDMNGREVRQRASMPHSHINHVCFRVIVGPRNRSEYFGGERLDFRYRILLNGFQIGVLPPMLKSDPAAPLLVKRRPVNGAELPLVKCAAVVAADEP